MTSEASDAVVQLNQKPPPLSFGLRVLFALLLPLVTYAAAYLLYDLFTATEYGLSRSSDSTDSGWFGVVRVIHLVFLVPLFLACVVGALVVVLVVLLATPWRRWYTAFGGGLAGFAAGGAFVVLVAKLMLEYLDNIVQ